MQTKNMGIHQFLLFLPVILLPCSAQEWWKINTWGTKNGGSIWNGGNSGGWWNNNNGGVDSFLSGLLGEFKKRNQILSNQDLSLQTLVDEATSFFLGDQEVSLDPGHLEEVDVLAPDAALYVDGFYTRPASLVYKSKADPSVRITMERGHLYSAFAQERGGKARNTCRLGETNSYVTYTTDDINDGMLGMYTLEEVSPPPEVKVRGRMLRSVSNSTTISKQTPRDLQAACSNFRVIEVSVVVDSLLCTEAGSAGAAESLVQSIIADASVFYEVPGLCVKLKLLNTYIFCNSGADPIRPMLNRAGRSNICSGSGSLLEQFTAYVAQENISGDVVHLFHAKDFTGTSTVGCAWMGTLCRSRGYNAGVNEMSFSNTPSSLAKLFAHENGHICGASHTRDRNDLMYGSLCSNCASGFGSSSIRSIGAQVDRTSCAAVERGGSFPPPPVPSPVAAPFSQPVPRPTWPLSPNWSPPTRGRPNPSPFPQPTGPSWPVWPAPSPPSWPIWPAPSSPSPPTAACRDERTFKFITNGESVGCSFVPTLSQFWKDFVCDFVGTSCAKSCGIC